MCKDWRTVPEGHEFLAAPLSLPRDIRQRSREEGEIDPDSAELAEGLLWSPSKEALDICKTGCNHLISSRVQQLHKLNWRTKRDGKAPIFAGTKGAVLFGTSSVLDFEKLNSILGRIALAENSFHDSGVGSSLQSLSCSRSTVDSSGDSSDLPVTPLSVDSIMASPPLRNTEARDFRDFTHPKQTSPPGSLAETDGEGFQASLLKRVNMDISTTNPLDKNTKRQKVRF
ncbi:hypothetical protein K505DRAFT_416596 [Melanomma pulvis-pyrius CBS 109.77]|uniref:Uncharacterized protein n=1 Tax=Melanomma pulvis-pyrius CBS 109.77 TaxID=1314802 RepID=A0A6A6XF91_9PLEO|nr:hypothetical protein K505DRAFT_416596 [Melanomma pulvis-pyrius CBS 109.77]